MTTIHRQVDYYNVDVIISAGYRAKSLEINSLKFGQAILKKYIKKNCHE